MRLAPIVLAAALLLALGATAPASAASYGFDCISDNRAKDCAIGEAQLRMDVTDPGGGKIDFTFTNLGPKASSITDIYWDDEKLFAAIFSITNSPGVAFSQGANPGNLPSANDADPDFKVTKGLLVDSDSPVRPRGVDPGETLVVRLSLIGGMTFGDVLMDLSDGSLRIGLHVQGMGKDKCGSESFVNLPGETPPIPEPGTFGLVAGGLLALGGARRARR